MGLSQVPDGDTQGLAVALEPVLREQCGGRLGRIEWFRAAWQRGGASTGFSTWRLDDGREIRVLIKLPVGPVEHRWTSHLGACDIHRWSEGDGEHLPVPRLVAGGDEVGGYDLAWLVVERFEGDPLGGRLSNAEHLPETVDALLRTAAEFQAAAVRQWKPDGHPKSPDWAPLLDRSREVAKSGRIAEGQKWNDLVKRVSKHLPTLIRRWETRPINAWCHGDLHGGNAMLRKCGDGSERCVLIDLAMVHPGHWTEDAVYLERQYWGCKELLDGLKPVSVLAKYRRELGLGCDDHYPELVNVRRVLMAACAPAVIDREGGPKYLHAALEQIERLLPQVCR